MRKRVLNSSVLWVILLATRDKRIAEQQLPRLFNPRKMHTNQRAARGVLSPPSAATMLAPRRKQFLLQTHSQPSSKTGAKPQRTRRIYCVRLRTSSPILRLLLILGCARARSRRDATILLASVETTGRTAASFPFPAPDTNGQKGKSAVRFSRATVHASICSNWRRDCSDCTKARTTARQCASELPRRGPANCSSPESRIAFSRR